MAPIVHARVSVFDHGLLYGDDVFEDVRCYRSRAFRKRCPFLAKLFVTIHNPFVIRELVGRRS